MDTKLFDLHFLLNNCGNKSTSVAIKVGEHFVPTLYMYRQNSSPISMTEAEFNLLKESESRISDFFDDHRDTKLPVSLNDTLRIRFDMWEGKLVIIERIGEQRNTSVYLAKTSWMRFVSYFNLVTHHFSRLSRWVPQIDFLIESLARYLVINHKQDVEGLHGETELKHLLARVDIKDIITSSRDNDIDYVGILEEIQVTCPVKLISQMRIYLREGVGVDIAE